MTTESGKVVEFVGPDCAAVRVSRSVYGLAAIFRACYRFTDNYYLFLRPDGADDLLVFMKPKRLPSDLAEAAGQFANDLIDQRLRLEVARETAVIRELIVAQAFAEGNLLPDSKQAADAASDPLKIAEHQ